MVNATVNMTAGEASSVYAMIERDGGGVGLGGTAAPEERTVAGIPVRLLWVPYVGLGLILVGLMLVSFLRYHRKHGHKYQQRRLELWKKFNVENLMEQLQEGVGAVGSLATGSLPPNGGMNISPSTSSTQPEPSAPSSSSANTAKTAKRPRRPLFFASNVNGSMVDVRCDGNTQTFLPEPAPLASTSSSKHPAGKKNTAVTGPSTGGLGVDSDQAPPLLPLLPGPSPSTFKTKSKASPVIWTLTRPRGRQGATKTPASFFSSPMDIQPDEIEAEDDEVFLLQQTPL